jgi:hypothetical protein
MSVRVPHHDQPIRVVFTSDFEGTQLRTPGRACRAGGGALFFTPDGFTRGFTATPDELEYECGASHVMPTREVEREERDAAGEFARMFTGARRFDSYRIYITGETRDAIFQSARECPICLATAIYVDGAKRIYLRRSEHGDYTSGHLMQLAEFAGDESAYRELEAL